MENNPHCEGSEATDTNHYYCERETERTKYKEASPTIKYVDSLV